MRVILQEKISNLGKVGDIVTVKPGYSRNYLIPKGKAMLATAANIKSFEARRAELEQKEKDRLDQSQRRATQLSTLNITVEARASEEGKLFGSISQREIAQAAKAQNVELDKNEIHLPEGPIRMTGDHDVTIFLHGDVSCTIKVTVTATK